MLESQEVSCPYCGEAFEAVIDTSVTQQSYIEDCEVCCRPIEFTVSIGESIEVVLRHENE